MSSIEHVCVVMLAAGEGKKVRDLANDRRGNRSFGPLSEALREASLTLGVIGDAHEPGQFIDATHSGGGVFAATEKGTDQ